MILNSKPKIYLFNVFLGLLIFFVLVIFRLPNFLNPQPLTSDEAFQASQILSLMNGDGFFFYFDGERYAGIFYGLTAIPFFWIFGVGTLAYKLPGTLFYALNILSTYYLVKKIQPTAALTVVLLMIFSSPVVLEISTHNYPHILTCLLGNLIFLNFFSIKESGGSLLRPVFFLGFFMGFSIYTYTYSILYIGTIAILFVLNHEYLEAVRAKFSKKMLMAWFMNQQGVKMSFVRIIDIIIFLFIGVVLFSYVFGGFGIDLAGYSIIQSNELHKPLGQLLVVIIFRMCLYRRDIDEKFILLRDSILSLNYLTKKALFIGISGFVIGILPRILSISTGETTRGGQGFDVDFVPTNLIKHFWKLISNILPELFGLRAPLAQLFGHEVTTFHFFNALMAAVVAFLIFKSGIAFIKPMWPDLKKIIRFKALAFNPSHPFVVFPVLVCIGNIIIQNGPVVRYLLPLFGVVVIWVSLYLDNIRKKSKTLLTISLILWCLFSTVGIYRLYESHDHVQNFSIVETKDPYLKVVEFLKAQKILYGYSDYTTSSLINFTSKTSLKFAEFTKDFAGTTVKERLARENEFAIIVRGEGSYLKTYRDYLDKNFLIYSHHTIVGESANQRYYVFWNFQGQPKAIDGLRSLIS